MINISFIVKISKETVNLQQTLEKLKEVIIIGDEVIFHIDPIDLTDENLEIINEYESISERYNKFTKTIIVHLIKVFSSVENNVENKCSKQVKYHVDSNLDLNQINTLRQ